MKQRFILFRRGRVYYCEDKDPAGIERIKKQEQKDQVELEKEAEAKKKLEAEIAREAAEEAMKRMQQNMNTLDTGPMGGMMRDILKDPFKAAKKYWCPESGFLY